MRIVRVPPYGYGGLSKGGPLRTAGANFFGLEENVSETSKNEIQNLEIYRTLKVKLLKMAARSTDTLFVILVNSGAVKVPPGHSNYIVDEFCISRSNVMNRLGYARAQALCFDLCFGQSIYVSTTAPNIVCAKIIMKTRHDPNVTPARVYHDSVVPS